MLYLQKILLFYELPAASKCSFTLELKNAL